MANKRTRTVLLAASCIVLLLACMLLVRWNYSSPGVSVTKMADEGLSGSGNSRGDEDALININTADAQELSTLPGIGDVLAERIVDYRSEHGSFKTIEDIMQVSGIGQKKFNEIESKITVNSGGQNEDTGS